ncbi:WD40-repeat-containing domain protein [Gilbertella persicaria]|uniref:WD40-repeat-containing domain protein n=1 Tax=Gilbertella persicaria TaxID=101096 RepID=UPI002220DCF3|nr:WD40-repeat-containing domain protein [Gilbertella persicaria]KAI8050652.1 WD40-repeat-containing domain protein [Gilbertella persicaria]
MESKKRSRNSEEMNDNQVKKKQILEKVTGSNTLLPTSALLNVEEDFRVVVGTYERLLFGINAQWIEDKSKVKLEPVFIIPAHTACIRTVSVGGNFLASGSSDEIIRLYDVKKRKEYGSLGGHHSGDITDIKFHGKYMLSASDDHLINLWRTKDWEYLKTLKGHKAKVNSMAIHPTGKIALSVSADRTAIVWNLMTGRKASVNKLGRDEPMLVLWNSSGDQYAIQFDKAIHIYKVADAKVSTTISHRSRFHSMQYFKLDEKEYIVTGSEDKTIRIWDTTSGECIREIKGHNMRVKSVNVLSTDGKLVLSSASSDGVIKCWDLEAAVLKEVEEPLGEYNTKCRVTCITSHDGFSKVENQPTTESVDLEEEEVQKEKQAEAPSKKTNKKKNKQKMAKN